MLSGLSSIFWAGPTVHARPTASQDTGTAEFKHWESEIGFEYEEAPDGREFVIAPAFTYGLTERLEAEISWDYTLESPDGEPSARQLPAAFEFKERFWAPVGEDGPSAGVGATGPARDGGGWRGGCGHPGIPNA